MSNDGFLCTYRKEHFARKMNLNISKNSIISQILGNKSTFSSAVTQKPKKEVVFFPARFDLELNHTLKSLSARSFGAAYLATCAIRNVHFDVQVEGGTALNLYYNYWSRMFVDDHRILWHEHEILVDFFNSWSSAL